MIPKRTKQFHHYKTLLLWDKDYRELLHGTGVSGIFTIVWMGLGYVVTVLSARWFGADGMGLMAMINTIIVFGGAIAGLGIQQSVVRYINQWKAQGVEGRIKTLHWYILKTVLPFSILIAVLLYFGRHWLAISVFKEPRLAELIVWLALAFPLIVLGNIGLEMVKGYKMVARYVSIQKIWKLVVKFTIITIVFMTTTDIAWPTYALIGSSLIGFFFAVPFLWKQWKQLPASESITNSAILKTSLPMMVASISMVIMNQTDIVMLGMMTSTKEVGIYQTAFRLATLVPFGLVVVNMIIPQKIAQLYHWGEKKKLTSLMKLWSLISWSIGLVTFIIFSFFARQRMALFGPEFIIGSTLLIMLCFGQLVNAAAGSVGFYLNMTGRQVLFQNIVLGTASLNIILNLILIPIYGMEWAAIASAVCLIGWNGVMVWLIWIKDSMCLFTTRSFR